MEKSITLFELLELVFLFSLAVSVLGRIIQFLYLRSKLKISHKRTALVLIISELSSWILTAIIWHAWPFEIDVMYYFICIPTLIGEMFILAFTFIIVRSKRFVWA